MKKILLASMLVIAANVTTTLFAGSPNDTPFEPNLGTLVSGDGWTVVNRNARLINDDGKKVAHFEGNAGRRDRLAGKL